MPVRCIYIGILSVLTKLFETELITDDVLCTLLGVSPKKM